MKKRPGIEVRAALALAAALVCHPAAADPAADKLRAALNASDPVAPAGDPVAHAGDDSWTAGTTARLRVRTTAPARHDGSYGAARLELETLADHRPIAGKDLEGLWQVLAYVPSSRAFVVGGRFEIGAWLPLDDIRYVDEATGQLRPSRYNDGSWMAFAAVPGPDGRFIAFVGEFAAGGAHGEGRFRLQLLDTTRDALFDLGPPPAPPPDPDPLDRARRRCDWGDPVDGLTAMDAGIITFADAHTLRASYGADGCTRRARRRRQRTWDLARVAATARRLSRPPPPELKNPLLPPKSPPPTPADPAREPRF